MIYMISNKHNAFDFPSFIFIGGSIFAISAALKGLASVLHLLPVVGQLANSLVACTFIAVIGFLAEKYYSSKAKA